jgi:hypothetical protein
MSDKIKRQKIMEREYFSYEEKADFALKSDNRCCHCGKKVFINYGATAEHFIPLSKGGTNRDINMIMLCQECNEKKDNFIYNPDDYLSYLKEEHMEKIRGYFDSYIKSFDFINRDNLLACDRYKISIVPMAEGLHDVLASKSNKKKRYKNVRQILNKQSKKFWMKRATMNDSDKLTAYFIKYLKKYNSLDSEYAARINIEFWLTFGCIYYIEVNDEIKVFVTVSVTKANDRVIIGKEKIDYFLTINIFSYYNTDNAYTIALNLSRDIPERLCKEQGLLQIPVRYRVLNEDTLGYDLLNGAIYHNPSFTESFMILYDGKKGVNALPPISNDEKLNNFFKKFGEINQRRLENWFSIHETDVYEWMLNELFLKPTDEYEDED